MTSDQERAAPAQQPVAWRYRYPNYERGTWPEWTLTLDGTLAREIASTDGEFEPLYTAPSEPELRAEIVRLTRERDELRSYAHEATRAITSLTVGGSEFFGRRIGDMYTADLPFCVEHVRDRERRAHDRHIQAVSEKRAAESRVEALSAALDEEIQAYSDPRHDCHTNRAVLIALNHVRSRAALDKGAAT